MKKAIFLGTFLALSASMGLTQAQEQKVLFCSESISYNKAGPVGHLNGDLCLSVCSAEVNTKNDCLSSETDAGWQVVATSPKEVPQNIGGGKCSCVGIQYVVKKENKPAASAQMQRESEQIALLKKEIELLKRENGILAKENSALKKSKK